MVWVYLMLLKLYVTKEPRVVQQSVGLLGRIQVQVFCHFRVCDFGKQVSQPILSFVSPCHSVSWWHSESEVLSVHELKPYYSGTAAGSKNFEFLLLLLDGFLPCFKFLYLLHFVQVLKCEVELMAKMAKTIDSFTQNQTRLVVIIDGLDACEQDKVLQMLDTVRLPVPKLVSVAT